MVGAAGGLSSRPRQAGVIEMSIGRPSRLRPRLAGAVLPCPFFPRSAWPAGRSTGGERMLQPDQQPS